MIIYCSNHPETAQRALAKLRAAFLKKHQQLRGSNYEITFLDDQVRQHTSDLETAEAQDRSGLASLEGDFTLQQ